MNKSVGAIIIIIFLALNQATLASSDCYTYNFNEEPNNVRFSDGKAELEGGELIDIPGAPQLGYRLVKIALPGSTRLKSIDIETDSPLAMPLSGAMAFSKGDIKTDLGSTTGETYSGLPHYDGKSIFPNERARIINSGYWGNIHIAQIAVYPIAYRPDENAILFYGEISIKFNLSPIESGAFIPREGDPLAFSILSETIVNKSDYNLMCSSPSPDLPATLLSLPSPEYLIITTREIAPGFHSYAEWKNEKGLPAQIEYIDDILAGSPGIDPPERLRNYLIGSYNQGVRWVLLGGDEDVIPIRYLFAGNVEEPPSPALSLMQPSDLYYADLTGNWDADSDGVYGETVEDAPDLYPELYIGRIPARDSISAAAWAAKAITYEKNPGLGDPSYLSKALVICADEMRDLAQHETLLRAFPSQFTVDATRLIEEPNGYSESPTQPSGQAVISAMQEGWGFVSNQNHGDFSFYAASSSGYNVGNRANVWGDTVFGIPDDAFSHLTDIGKPGIHYSTSCYVGAYDFDKGVFYPGPYATTYSLAESYLFQPGGGAAFLGYTRWGWASASFRLERKFIARAFTDSTDRLGVAEALSKIDYPTYPDILYGHNLLGDPETELWNSIEGTLRIYGPIKIRDNLAQTLYYHVLNGDNPVADARVCLYREGELFLTSTSDDAGRVEFDIDAQTAGQMYVTATKSRFIPAQNTVTIGTQIGIENEQLPRKLELLSNYPNPFNSNTTIEFILPLPSKINIRVFDITGRLVRNLANETFNAGRGRVIWDSKNDQGQFVSSGIYFYKFENGDATITKPMTLLK
jgi:hypothetical protein